MKRSLSSMDNIETEVAKKKWKGTVYKQWTATSVPNAQKYKKPTEKELTEVSS